MVRWAVGLLRDSSPEVRGFAAHVLVEAEYTAAIPDLKAVISVEKDDTCRSELQAALLRFEGIIKNSKSR
jgi:HEAT repeat protein